jgi:hypothetical protein
MRVTGLLLALAFASTTFAQVERKPVEQEEQKRGERGTRLTWNVQAGQTFNFQVQMTPGAGAGQEERGLEPQERERTRQPVTGAGTIEYRLMAIDTTPGTGTTFVVMVKPTTQPAMPIGETPRAPTGETPRGLDEEQKGRLPQKGAGDEQFFIVKVGSDGRMSEILSLETGKAVTPGQREAGRPTPMPMHRSTVAQVAPHAALMIGSGLHNVTLEPGKIYFEKHTVAGEPAMPTERGEVHERGRMIGSMFAHQLDLDTLRLRFEGTGQQEGQEVARFSILKVGEGATEGTLPREGEQPGRETRPEGTTRPGEAGQPGRTLGQAFYRLTDGILQSCNVDVAAGQRITIRRTIERPDTRRAGD